MKDSICLDAKELYKAMVELWKIIKNNYPRNMCRWVKIRKEGNFITLVATDMYILGEINIEGIGYWEDFDFFLSWFGCKQLKCMARYCNSCGTDVVEIKKEENRIYADGSWHMIEENKLLLDTENEEMMDYKRVGKHEFSKIKIWKKGDVDEKLSSLDYPHNIEINKDYYKIAISNMVDEISVIMCDDRVLRVEEWNRKYMIRV